MTAPPDANPASPPSSESQALSEALRLGFSILRVVMIVLLTLTVLRSSVFIVPQQQNALVLRFGRITGYGDSRIRGPGPHWALPAPIDEIVRLPGDQMVTVQSDSFYHGMNDPASDGHMPRRPYFHAAITADRNLLHSRWTIRYTVSDPEAYVFKVNDIDRLLRMELDRAILLATVRIPVDRALRADRELRETVHRQLGRRVDALGLGIRIQQVEADRISPPPAVANAFDNVIMAEQESNEIVSQARVNAARIVGEARAAAADRLGQAQADAVRLSEKTAADAGMLRALRDAGLSSTDHVQVEALRIERLMRLLGGDDPPALIRLSPPADHRELRLLLGGDDAATFFER